MFHKDFGKPEPISETARRAVDEILESGRLFRYQGTDTVADAELDFAKYVGSKYALGLNSGGCAIFMALKCLNLEPNAPVLTNAFTLSPVPGAIVHAGLVPVLVECKKDTASLSFEGLVEKHRETGSKVLVLSYMRGRVPDSLDEILDYCEEHCIRVVEDCAHSLGASYKSYKSSDRATGGQRPRPGSVVRNIGTLGAVGVFSLQTNKLMNAGEGGFLVTDDEELLAHAVIMSGSYGHFGLHKSRGSEELFAKLYPQVPNFSMRMSAITGALVRAQLSELPAKVAAYNKHWRILEQAVLRGNRNSVDGEDGARSNISTNKEFFLVPPLFDTEANTLVGSSFQFHLNPVYFDTYAKMDLFFEKLKARGVACAWFGREQWLGFTSNYNHWNYCKKEALSGADELLKGLFDMPLYHTNKWEGSDFEVIGRILWEVGEEVVNGG